MHRQQALAVILLFFALNGSVLGARKSLPVQERSITPYMLPTELLFPKSLELGAEGRYFKSTGHWLYDGTKIGLQEQESYQETDGKVFGRYGLSSEFDFLFGLQFRQAQSELAGQSVTASGLESLFISARIGFPALNSWRYAIEGRFRQSAYTNTEYAPGGAPSDELILGDAGHEIGFFGHVSFLSSDANALSLSVGYNIPPEQLSHEILYNIENVWTFNDWAFVIGLKGIYSLRSDEYGDAYALKPSVSRGSSQLYQSINREKIAPYLQLNKMLTNSIKIYGRASQVVYGNSTDEGYEVMAGLTFLSVDNVKKTIKLNEFKEYSVEAEVVKVSPRGLFVKLNKGLADSIEKGKSVDFYHFDSLGGNQLVATGIIYDTGSDWAIAKLTKYYLDMSVEEGFLGRIK